MPMMQSESATPDTSFSLVAGGPFYLVLRRLGLLGADRLTTLRCATFLALLAWLPPALLAVAQSLADGSDRGWSYFTDLTVPARYLIAIWAMVATERYADSRFKILGLQFREAKLLSRDSLPRYEAILAIADRRSSAWLAEAIMLALALVFSGSTIHLVITLTGASWEGSLVGGQVELSWAGAAARYVSNPLYLFLLLRWGWWFLVWAALLFRISRLPLQLIPTHPDRAAGLGFLSIYPSVFTGFTFALSCVISASILKDLAVEQRPAEIVWFAVAGWLGLNLLVFLGPLLVFALPLHVAREKAQIEYGRMATRQHVTTHRKWTGRTDDDEGQADVSGLPSTSELNTTIQAIREMGYTPINRAAVTQVVVAAGLPLVAVVFTLVPLDDLIKWALGKFL
jgi:hypothetical protein